MNTQTPRTEFAQALKAIAAERGLDANVIIDAIKQAIVAAFRRDAKESGIEYPEETVIDAEINSLDGGAKVLIDGKDVTPPGFGRIAAQTAKQVIHQKIREAERGVIMEEFTGKIGSLVSGIVLRFDGPNVRVDMGRTEGFMPAEERIPSERLSQSQRLTFLLKDIRETIKGREIILSRADPAFVVKLFAREVPEIGANSVDIKLISREAGVRTKIAVYSTTSGVDPVGSCVGQKGVRVQAVTNELGGERVDVIPWNEDFSELIKLALAPAENLVVKINKKTLEAKVTAPEDQLSLAIGKEGQNVRLASKLTGFKIEILGVPVEVPTVEDKKEDVKEEKVEKKETTKKTGKEEIKKEKVIEETKDSKEKEVFIKEEVSKDTQK
ncbi:transcription termination factor NusA [Candidatus Woesebacteria bacterium RIFOXYC1_FULL_31_51]|uniref:Transcription termination/antitermination protein NusA n=1 Tax=Candidatus Woesebacteria bacterium GW2011_GWC2_31_9 TaxID=1618586 RepID=A0A0F9YXV3_9BACT|nr:MAG: NusA antitermination factor, N utilization substance protein A [Candidatus Woesebacteria bacterium GW2011_GWF1_31_35]KKP23282.1 MAG: NusA antitermination factor [Candidatus Woesebacteria bacterium GW2011_GWC1_30_29]KKP26199.1 MAG: NusA antitermination factor [Candidatus Woesebacteria bacterium GW2011_GWD1_31_12]KKP27544.1 MAG: NusA antitermination factor [Candidatus Woesebacteria bacterium GW2011_GWB1_31_29]KKP31281.1 MAG: NusA antitermination factor [Candidatus Woesebacteria bacterium 